MNQKILLKNMHIISGDSEMYGDVFLSDGKIEKIAPKLENLRPDFVIDGSNRLCVCGGLFDMHVHFRDPGFTHKEDVLTGCNAAAHGGVTGVCCMPNTNPPTDTPETVEYIREKAKNTGVEVYPVGCITKGMKGEELSDFAALKKAGCLAVSDDGKPVKNAALMLAALKEAYKCGLAVISHCEDMDIIKNGIVNDGEVSKELSLAGMDRASEDSITAREIALAAASDTAIHIAHVSTKGSVALVRDAKKRGVKVSCETCPHYFIYTDEKIRLKDADYRMNPPLRTESDRLAVMEGVLDGTIDCIVTDHAPHTAEEKAVFEKAPNGVVGLETSLAATLTALYHTGKITLCDVVKLMSENPRAILGIDKAGMFEGNRAELTVFDPDKKWTVEPEKLHSKSHNTVFKGETFTGKAVMTISDGRILMSELE